MAGTRRTILIFTTLAGALVLALLYAVAFGGSRLGIAEIAGALLHPGSGDVSATILWHIRIPRIALGLLVGMGLAASGCVFQGMLRNPLADPYTLGVSGGAALGATLGIVLGLSGRYAYALPLFAFLGTLLSVYLVFAIASRERFAAHTLILSGVILSFIFSALVLLVFALSNASRVHSALLWLMGDLSSAEAGLTGIVAAVVPAGILVLALFGRELNILTLGEEKASHLGVETHSARRFMFILASFVTGCCVAASGVIGFVGLIIPHVMRRLTGPDHRVLIPASALGGALFLLVCDTVARTILAPVELPVGVITGLIGGVFFLGFLTKPGRHAL